jgi:hypothetical protein
MSAPAIEMMYALLNLKIAGYSWLLAMTP